MTLYIFDKYGKNKSKNGSMVWAYDGKPLYTFIKDTKRGDITGAGAGGVWHVSTSE
jgi:predicted lipoprotein with Yx(FWY)xxD motif